MHFRRPTGQNKSDAASHAAPDAAPDAAPPGHARYAVNNAVRRASRIMRARGRGRVRSARLF